MTTAMDTAILNEVAPHDGHDEFLRSADGDIVAERHSRNDPNVWGLLDVSVGRRPAVPTTIYRISGDSASGVAGRLTPDGVFHPIHSTRIGNEFVCGLLHDVKPSVNEVTVTYATAWDGASPAPEFKDHDDNVRKERTRGALLGDYAIRRNDRRPQVRQVKTPKVSNGASYIRPYVPTALAEAA